MDWISRIWIGSMFLLIAGLGVILGRIWDTQATRPELVIKRVPAKNQTTKSSSESNTKKGAFVASRNGTKFYPRGCGAIERIHKENRIYFSTKQQARTSGLERTELCENTKSGA